MAVRKQSSINLPQVDWAKVFATGNYNKAPIVVPTNNKSNTTKAPITIPSSGRAQFMTDEEIEAEYKEEESWLDSLVGTVTDPFGLLGESNPLKQGTKFITDKANDILNPLDPDNPINKALINPVVNKVLDAGEKVKDIIDETINPDLGTDDTEGDDGANAEDAYEKLYRYYLNQGYTHEEAHAMAMAALAGNSEDEESTTETSGTNDIKDLLEEIIGEQATPVVPSIDMDTAQPLMLNKIQMLAMKVKATNPKLGQQIWNMAKMPIKQTIELFEYYYQLASMQPQQRYTKYKERRYNNEIRKKMGRKKAQKYWR